MHVDGFVVKVALDLYMHVFKFSGQSVARRIAERQCHLLSTSR